MLRLARRYDHSNMGRVLMRALLVSVALMACVTACSGANATSPSKACTMQGPTVQPSTATVRPGDTIQLTVTVQSGCAPTPVWLWKSSAPAIASVDSTSGLVTGVSAGTVSISVTDQLDLALTGGSTITVSQ